VCGRALTWVSGYDALAGMSGSDVLAWMSGYDALTWMSGSDMLAWLAGSDMLAWLAGEVCNISKTPVSFPPGRRMRLPAKTISMFKNYLTIALRQLGKQKFYSAIKIGGFALGIATCLLITLYIRHELSYDKSYPDAGRIYRVLAVYNNNGKIGQGTAFAAPFAKTVKATFPQIELAGRLMPFPLFWGAGSNEVKPEGKMDNTYEEGFTYADQSLLDMLQLPMVYGDRAHALSEPNTIVLSRRKAEKYFPHQNPVGRLFYLNNEMKQPWKIGGVMEDMPSTTHLQYDFLLSLTGHELWNGEQNNWNNQNYETYVKLQPGTDPVQMAEKMQTMWRGQLLPLWTQNGMKDADKQVKNMGVTLQPIGDVHLHGLTNDSHESGNSRFVRLFGIVAGFILLLACINFINLSTARSAGRAREVGLRKVIGSRRGGLIRQFLLESLVLSFFSFLLAVVLAWLLLPLFNRMADTSMVFPWREWWLAPVTIGAAALVGLLAGIYPAIYLSRFKPVDVLKGQASLGVRHGGLRSVLVIFQFTTSIILIIATFIVHGQMDFLLNRKLGFEKDQVIQVQGVGSLNKQMLTFRDELLKVPGVKNASYSDFLPVEGSKRNMGTVYNQGKEKEETGVGAQFWNVDQRYIPTMGIQLLQGRNFSEDLRSDSVSAIVNETMVRRLGLKDPLGKSFGYGKWQMRIVGVIKDFNFESREEIGPLVLTIANWANTMSVKMNTADVKGTIGRIAALWKSFSPHQEFRYVFMDESFARMYADVQRTELLFTSFSVLAVIIACLGLFALSAFMAEQRSKEIGIRKVLGATVAQMAGLLSMNFVKLVVIAFVIASPIAWWGMHNWLQDFVYRIDVSGWVFAASGGLVVAIALLTISFQAMRAAMANPVKSLRAE
jgi:putative ABC transport system permease protein